MPSSTLRHLGNQPGQPVMQPAFKPSYRPDDVLLGSHSFQSIGAQAGNGGNISSQTYPSANRAHAVPFEIGDNYLVRKVWWINGTTATTDSADVGVYTEAGALLVSGGGTAIATANVVQEVDVADTLLVPGRYWLAYAQNGVTATPFGAFGTALLSRQLGCAQMNAAYVLPGTFTPAAMTGTFFPACGIAARLQVA